MSSSNHLTAPQLVIDAQDLRCPMPLLKAKQGLARVAEGDIVQLIATDPASERDVLSFVELTAHELVGFQQEQQIYTYYIRKGINA